MALEDVRVVIVDDEAFFRNEGRGTASIAASGDKDGGGTLYIFVPAPFASGVIDASMMTLKRVPSHGNALVVCKKHELAGVPPAT